MFYSIMSLYSVIKSCDISVDYMALECSHVTL